MYRLASLLLISVASGQIQLDGNCNLANINYQKEIDLNAITGDWHEISRINNVYENGSCPTWTLTAVTDNSIVVGMKITTKQVDNGKLLARNGTITLSKDYLTVTYTDGVSIRFVILKTDYTNYAVLYSCVDAGTKRSVIGWSMSRTRTASSAADEVIKGNADLATVSFTKLSHTEEACKVNSAINVHITPFVLLIVGLIISKQL